MSNPYWFEQMRRHHCTVKFIRREWGVTRAIAEHIQSVAARGGSLRDCNSVAAAARALVTQVGV